MTSIHAKGIVHANLKPSKILVSVSKHTNFYITDFSKCHIVNEDSRNRASIILQEYQNQGKPGFQRNPNIFSGKNIHNGSVPTIGDDYESLVYMLLYFLKGGKWFLKDIENFEEKGYEYQMRALNLYKLTTPIEKQCGAFSRFLIYFFLNILLTTRGSKKILQLFGSTKKQRYAQQFNCF